MLDGNTRIDWRWVSAELLKKERIPRSGQVRDAARACLKEARRLARPRIISAAKKIAGLSPGAVTIAPSINLRGKRLSAAIKGASAVRIFVATIGDALERAASRYMEKGDSLDGYLMDRIGSFAVESLAENYEESLRRAYAAKGASVSARLSPGYCDWPVEEQRKLAKLVKFSKVGVRLTEACMMVPRKSISAIVGIGPKGLFSRTGSRCGTCDNTSCSYRSVS